MYFRFSPESSAIRRPHTQYMTPGLQWLRQNLHCHFGSVWTISEISRLPDSLIAFFDSALNTLNDCLWSRSFWTACFCGWRVILRISWRMFKVSERFTVSSGMPETLKSIFVSVRRCKVKLVHCITTFEMIVFLHCVPPLFQVSLSCRDFGHVVLPLTQVSLVCRKNLVLFATHQQQQSVELRVSPNSLDWFWAIGFTWKNRNELFLQVTVERISQLVDVQP